MYHYSNTEQVERGSAIARSYSAIADLVGWVEATKPNLQDPNNS